MDYDLGRLGESQFEHLTQSLAIAQLGAGVEIFGDGPDGGREASFKGDFDMQTGVRWSGYCVLQVRDAMADVAMLAGAPGAHTAQPVTAASFAFGVFICTF